MTDFPAVPFGDLWKARRTVTLTRAGAAVTKSGKLYGAVLVGLTGGQHAKLFDATNVPENIFGAVATSTATPMGSFPAIPYTSLPFRRGLYVSFSDPGTERTLLIAWDDS